MSDPMLLLGGLMMTIGQISELSGYSQRMIRFLEENELIKPKRSDSNLRYFSELELKKILEIKRLKELGFTYSEIKKLIQMSSEELVPQGVKLLKKHQNASRDLHNKIKKLEVLCYGHEKTKSPKRTAYKIPVLNDLYSYWKENLNLESRVEFWTFSEFMAEQDQALEEFHLFEIFKRSSQIAVFQGLELLPQYAESWKKFNINLDPISSGKFTTSDAEEFYGNNEIIFVQKLFDVSGELHFLAIMPYQSIFLATGSNNRAC